MTCGIDAGQGLCALQFPAAKKIIPRFNSSADSVFRGNGDLEQRVAEDIPDMGPGITQHSQIPQAVILCPEGSGDRLRGFFDNTVSDFPPRLFVGRIQEIPHVLAADFSICAVFLVHPVYAFLENGQLAFRRKFPKHRLRLHSLGDIGRVGRVKIEDFSQCGFISGLCRQIHQKLSQSDVILGSDIRPCRLTVTRQGPLKADFGDSLSCR